MISEESFIEINEGMVCSMEYIKEFLQRLQKKEGEDMKIYQNSKEVSIHCSNIPKDICPFRYLFTKKVDVESKEIGLELKKKHTQHSVNCKVFNQDISFERNRSLIINSKELAKKIILSRYQQHGPENPKKILQLVSRQLGYNDLFINQGLRSQSLRRKIKKKFDNLVAEIRKEHNLIATKLKKKQSIKPKSKFSLFSSQSQSCQNQQEYEMEQISEEEENIDEDSQFEPPLRREKINIKKRRIIRSQRKGKNLQQQGNSSDDLQNSQTLTNALEINETKSKRKIIKKQW